MTSLYLQAIRKLYLEGSKLKFLLLSGLLNDYLESVNIVNTFYEWYQVKDIENLISKLPKLDTVRTFLIRYLTAYLSYKGEDPHTVDNLANSVNYYVSTVITQLNSAIEFFITKAKGERAQYLAVQRILLYIGELLEFYKMILLEEPDKAIDFVRVKYHYIVGLVERQTSLAKKLKQLGENIEEIPLESLGEVIEEEGEEGKGKGKKKKKKEEEGGIKNPFAKQPHESAYLADRAMKKYTEELMKQEEIRATSSKLSLFNKMELNFLYALLRREAICPEYTTVESICEAISTSPEIAHRIARQIDTKTRDRFGHSILLIEETRYGVKVCLLRKAMDIVKTQLAQYHPDLVKLYEEIISRIEQRKR